MEYSFDLLNGPHARRAFAQLLDQAFQVPPDHAFLGDFPIWDEQIVPSSHEIARMGAFTPGDNKLVACAGVRMAQIAGTKGKFPVALIGAVATSDAHRGEGLASALVSLATEWAQTRGAAGIFLWGSEYSLYRKLGFELCGTQVMLPLDGVTLAAPPSEAVQTGWDSLIFKRMKERSGGVVLTDADERWMASHRSVQWFWIGNSQKCDAYVAIGRGIDLQGVVHEWGGDRDALHALFGWVKAQAPGLILLGAPWTLKGFGISCEGGVSEFLCLARILDPDRIVKAFAPAATSECSASPEAARYLFGPETSGALGPLPLWIWGLDAV